MPLANLVGPAQSQSISALAALDAGTQGILLASASEQVRGVTHRDFTYASYTELYSGGDKRQWDPIRLRQYPVHRISRMAADPVPVLLVSNNGSTCQRATVETLEDGTGLKLQYQISGATVQSQSFLYATYTTLASLVTAINAFGNGFTASVPNTLTNVNTTLVASADLWPLQGAASCIGAGAYLTLYAEDIAPYNWGPSGYNDNFTIQSDGYGWRLDGETGEVYGNFPRGNLNVRIDYVAGYQQIPADVQQATLIVAKYLLDSGNVNYTMKSATLGRAQVVVGTGPGSAGIPPSAYGLLKRYIAHDRIINRN